MARAWRGMCESDTAALCKSNRKDTFQTLNGTAWARHATCESSFSATPVFVFILFHLFIFFPFPSSLFAFSPLIPSTFLFPSAPFLPLFFVSSFDFVYSVITSFLRFRLVIFFVISFLSFFFTCF